MTERYNNFYHNRRVLITGGAGFIGSNLAHRLVALGADVSVIDSLIPDYGGNLFNLHDIKDQIKINISDVRDENAMHYLVQDRDVIFNLAGQVSHLDSMRDPYTDLEINCRSQLSLLEACRKHNTGVRPVTEDHLVRPVDVNGINKVAGEYYHLLYNDVFNIRACSLRLSNIYGPRQLIKHNRQGFIGWFIRLVVENQEIEIFGDGSQIRDLVYVDDAAEAFLLAGASDQCNGNVYNVGGSEPTQLNELVALLIEVAGQGRVTHVPWPAEKQSIDIGSFSTDSTKFKSTVGWIPRVSLKQGLQDTVDFYRCHLDHYLDT